MKDSESTAEALIRATGDRVTAPRVQVLGVLLAAGRALTHAEIEARLDPELAINRVTVYRVLDWLTEHEIAHKLSSDDRVWRFSVQEAGHAGEHPHFVCNACGRVLCLATPEENPKPRLPVGFQPTEVELTVKGLCDACSEHSRRTVSRGRRRT